MSEQKSMNLITVKKEFEDFFKKFKSIDDVNLLMEFLDLTVSEYKKDPSNLINYKNEKHSIKRLSKTKKDSLVKFKPIRIKQEQDVTEVRNKESGLRNVSLDFEKLSQDQRDKNSQECSDLLCQICGSESYFGHRFGVDFCEPCFNFFRSNVSLIKEFKCINNGNCKILPKSKNNCKKCHVEKVLKAGFNKKIQECSICDRMTLYQTKGVDACVSCGAFIWKYASKPIKELKCNNDKKCFFDRSIIRACNKCRLRKFKEIKQNKN